jgi:transposase
MPKAILVPIRQLIVERHLKGETLGTIALALGLSYGAVRTIWRRYRLRGDAGLIPDHRRCGRRRSAGHQRMMRAACWLKRHHPAWGARLIRDLLRQRWPDRDIPCERTLQFAFQKAGLNRPAGCPRRFESPPREGLGPHRHWGRNGEELNREWMLDVLQGGVPAGDMRPLLKKPGDLDVLLDAIRKGGLRDRNKAMTVLAERHGVSMASIARFLRLDLKTVSAYCHVYEIYGCERLFKGFYKRVSKADDERLQEMVFAVLHEPPSAYGINRTTWKMDDLRRVLGDKGFKASPQVIRMIIRSAGYTWRKAREVLTSNDPLYREKLEKIQSILSTLGPNERFFSIDEYGPFAVKIQGGRSLTPRGQVRIVPQRQQSKGSVIVTGALELSTNQVTHFYSEKKNTAEMIGLLEVLLVEYKGIDKMYFSWDAASWHASKALYNRVEEINSPEYRSEHGTPLVELAPLPSCAQFLNVIEAVFSGMARAIIHNSDYESVEACKAAIDRYFAERNAFFRANPRRAGRKIWGKEKTPSEFSASNNCKDPSRSYFGL